MSKFYEVRPVDVLNFLNTHKIKFRESSANYQLQFCPLCPKPHNNDYSNMYTMNVIKATGTFHCFRCGSKGNWFDFKDKVVQRFYGKSLNELIGNTSSLSGQLIDNFNQQGSYPETQVNAKYDIK